MKWHATRDRESDLWRVEGDAGCVEVRAASGSDLLRTLEMRVAEAIGLKIPPAPDAPRWRIDESTYSHGDLYELEQDTIWTVVDAVTGTPLWEFRGGTSHNFSGGGWSESTGSHGCDEVVLGADGLHVLARDGNKVGCHPLPV